MPVDEAQDTAPQPVVEAPSPGAIETQNQESRVEHLLEMEPDVEEKKIEEPKGINDSKLPAGENSQSLEPAKNEAQQQQQQQIPIKSSPREPTGKGAQILMNRFQSLKERANQNAQILLSSPAISTNAKAVQERAGTFWKTAAPRMETLRSTLKKVEPTASSTAKPAGIAVEVEAKEKPKGAEEGTSDGPAHAKQVQPNEFSLQDGNEESSQSESVDSDNTDEESNVGANSDAATRLLVGQAFTKASLAASVAYESVLATGFRGRYNTSMVSGNKMGESVTDTRPMPDSQLDIILKSRVGQHMQEILEKLEPHEYAMLLGRGMLGVNLKQCYLKNHGVFIDFLVPGGQAESSGVVRSGDLPVRLGDLDFRKGTILDIPLEISKARRPVVLTLATGTKVELERMNFIDVAVAMMHRARDLYTKRGTLSNLPSASPSRGANDIKSVSDVTVPPADTIDSFLTPPAPNLDIRREFVEEVPLRNLDKFVVDGLSQVYDMDCNFREAVRNAFLTCALDGRRLPFLSRHFSSCDEEFVHAKMTPTAQLMLFLELTSFLDLYNVTPAARLRETAMKITHKFFLPTTIGNKLQPPLFDFHHMVPDAALRHLELVLNAKTQTIPRDIFFDFIKAVVDSLTGSPFISFLTSSECSRMRAYLRNTAPYFNLPLRDVMDGLVGETKNPSAKNCFTYILLFLICQVEKEPAGEHNFGNEVETKTRLVGASNDLCCPIFVRRTFLPALQDAKSKLEELKSGEQVDSAVVEKVVDASVKFWDFFIDGTLQSTRDEVGNSFHAVQTELQRIAAEVLSKGDGVVSMTRETAELFTKSTLADLLNSLAEEMIFKYAANTNSKFREHKFHEWMCNEIAKLRAKDPTWNNRQEIPSLPQGSVKRLLRKADLPDGVSSHKPFKKPREDYKQGKIYPNAELAVIFGSAVGNDLACEMPVPGLESSDIRRYTCRQVSIDRDDELDSSFAAEEALPPTFEGYAIAPPQKQRPFAQQTDASRISKDGWEVSLVNFTIPNSEGSDSSSALYGVSLFFQCKPDRVAVVQDRIDEFTCEDSNAMPTGDDSQSPIIVRKIEDNDSETIVGDLGKKGYVKNVAVSEPIPAFNSTLKSTSWVSRVLGEEYRDPLQPISIGLALVSRNNVILAMRDTLSRLLVDYCRGGDKESSNLTNCGVLVDVLGNFANADVENNALKCILEPYLQKASRQWIERPLSCQATAFEDISLRQMTDCLAPTPLALLFITALLEQKIILSSSRRSLLQSTTVALSALLNPLKWSHLLVPLVPSSLAADLIQYPAPFILGIPSQDSENAALLGSLPRDVTLVDLDIGRVILAPEFGVHNEMVRKSQDPAATAGALRSQVLYLAQALGTVFGNSLKPSTWLCDVAIPSGYNVGSGDGIVDLKAMAKGFISELLEGVSVCCFWIEEAAQTYGTSSEPTVLFDEDKFFEIKNHRANQTHKPLFPDSQGRHSELALSLTAFDLVIESFLRCQSMSTYISSRPKTDMVYY